MAKGKRRQNAQKTRNAQRKERYANMDNTIEQGDSLYARKSRWLHRHGLFGFEVPEPKPWRKGTESGSPNKPIRKPPVQYDPAKHGPQPLDRPNRLPRD